MKHIITQAHINKATELDQQNKLGFHDIQLSPVMYVTFGTYGLSLTRLHGPFLSKQKCKFVMDWKAKTVEQINAELASQPWDLS